MSNKDDSLFELEGKKILKLSPDTEKSVQIFSQHAGKIAVKEGLVRCVGIRDIKRGLKENPDGFIIPVPEIDGPIWNTKLAKMCRLDEENTDILYDLFDDETQISPVRSWYYTNLSKYILRTYMLPLKRLLKSAGKMLFFDLGYVEMQYDLMKRMINPDIMRKAGLSFLVHKESGNIEKELGFSKGDIVVSNGVAEEVAERDTEILVVKPMRGVMERFIQGEIKNRPNRLETPALLSAIESVYYCDMLAENGYSFDATDEIHLQKVSSMKRYKNILICKSCLFTEKEKKSIDKLVKQGVKINHSDLVLRLTEKGEN